MAAIVNYRDTVLQATGTRMVTVSAGSTVTLPFDNVTGSNKPANNADVTVTAVNGGILITGGGITLSGGGSIKGGQTGYNSGTGFFLGYSGAAYKFSVGNSSGDRITFDGSTFNFVGALTGTGSINITGNAIFKGNYTGTAGNASAVYADTSGGAQDGITGVSSSGSGIGVHGISTSTGVNVGTGVVGISTASTNGTGVYGFAAAGVGAFGESNGVGTGVVAKNTSSTGFALKATGAAKVTSSNTDTALTGEGSSSTHGVRGKNITAGTSGLVGVANGYNFYADGTPTGSFDYGTFTGAHDCLIPVDADVEIGDLVADVQTLARAGWSNTISEMRRSSAPNQKGVAGVLVGFIEWDAFTPMTLYWNHDIYYEIKARYRYGVFNGLGEGQIFVTGEGGDLEVGDLLVSSSTPGKAMKQADDIVRGCTVAKSREDVVFSSPEEIKQVACYYVAA